jgi:hypothetical protein
MQNEYFKNLRERVLDINLEANPNPNGMAVRAIRMALLRRFSLTPRLAEFTLKYFPKEERDQFQEEFRKQLLQHTDKTPERNFRFSHGKKLSKLSISSEDNKVEYFDLKAA